MNQLRPQYQYTFLLKPVRGSDDRQNADSLHAFCLNLERLSREGYGDQVLSLEHALVLGKIVKLCSVTMEEPRIAPAILQDAPARPNGRR